MSKEQHFGFIKIEDAQVILENNGLRGFIEGLNFPQTVSENVISATAELFHAVTEQVGEIFERETDVFRESVETLQKRVNELEEKPEVRGDFDKEAVLQALERIAGIKRTDLTSDQKREIDHIANDLGYS